MVVVGVVVEVVAVEVMVVEVVEGGNGVYSKSNRYIGGGGGGGIGVGGGGSGGVFWRLCYRSQLKR